MSTKSEGVKVWRKLGVDFFLGIISLTVDHFHHKGDEDTDEFNRTACFVILRELQTYAFWLTAVFPKHSKELMWVVETLRQAQAAIQKSGKLADQNINSGRT